MDVKSDIRVSKYGVNIQAVDLIMDKLMESFEDADIFLVDEIGKMELYSEKIKQRGDSKVFTLNTKNQDEVFNEITSALI